MASARELPGAVDRDAAPGYSAAMIAARRPPQIAIVDNDLCDECGLFMPLCTPAALHMTRKGLLVDAATCTGCVKCIAPCPVGALTMVNA